MIAGYERGYHFETPHRIESTTIIGPTDMTITRKAYTMVAMPVTTLVFARQAADIITIVITDRSYSD